MNLLRRVVLPLAACILTLALFWILVSLTFSLW